MSDKGKIGAGLAILKRGPEGGCLRQYFELPLLPGKGFLISTYSGDYRDPLPSFRGEPRELDLKKPDAQTTAAEIYETLAPSPGGDDYRVAVVCVFFPLSFPETRDACIINRSERKAI